MNGVLRYFIRDGKSADFSRLRGERRLSAEYSAPLWLCEKWVSEFGAERTEKALSASLGAPPIYLRVNTTKITAGELVEALREEGVSAAPCGEISSALTIDSIAQKTPL